MPNNYVGWVQIIYNQEGFTAIKQANGRNIFTIPESGVLKVVPVQSRGLQCRAFL
ncbi:DUF6843 domain-containing protein [Paenibacillus silagei]|uniref:DUF6843 domain-containing protein n=1 Tax=Paenibacillus silagei TaxID=1670801 RepID=UPI003CC92B2E